MSLNFNPVRQSNPLNVYRINQSITRQNGSEDGNRAGKMASRDTVSITPQGKAKSLLETLMKQKMDITERKNSLISSTIEKGGTLDSIKSQIETYDEQLKNIDEQAAQMTAKEMKDQTEAKNDQGDKEPKTEEEIQNERLADITSLSTGLEQAETVRSVKTRVDGDARVLKSEIELDKMRAGSSPGAAEFIAKKEGKLAELQHKSQELSSEVTDKIADTAEKITENNEPQEVSKEKEQNSMEKNKLNNEKYSDEKSDDDIRSE